MNQRIARLINKLTEKYHLQAKAVKRTYLSLPRNQRHAFKVQLQVLLTQDAS